LVSLLALIVLLVAGGLPVLAQDGAPVTNCNGLSEADCAILTKATAAMQSGIESFSIPAWSFAFDMEAGPVNSVSFDGSGSGTVVLPPSLLAISSDLPATGTLVDIAPLVALLQQLDITLVEQAIAETGLDLSIDHLALDAPGQTTSISADLIVKDSTLYTRLEAPNGAEAWFGDKLEMIASDREDLAQSINDLITQLQSEETQQALAQASELQGVRDELNTLIGQYVTTTRGADVEAMGQTMQVFSTTFDLKGLLNDPDLAATVMKVIQNPALTELGVNAEDVENLNETQVKFVLMTAGLLITDSSFTMTQWIGADDSYLHKVESAMNLAVDTKLFGENTGFDVLTLSAEFALELDQINSANLAGVTLPATYHTLDDSDNFLVGSPDMIEADLRIGQTFSGLFTAEDDQKDIYSLTLEPGQTVTVELTSDDYPYLKIYGPDGFLIGDYDTYTDHIQTLTAEQGGVYLLDVEAYWDMKYDLTIRGQ
jgi:hypothetical protein